MTAAFDVQRVQKLRALGCRLAVIKSFAKARPIANEILSLLNLSERKEVMPDESAERPASGSGTALDNAPAAAIIAAADTVRETKGGRSKKPPGPAHDGSPAEWQRVEKILRQAGYRVDNFGAHVFLDGNPVTRDYLLRLARDKFPELFKA